MKKTAIIYVRRSMDRSERQLNTHITQLKNCRQVCENNNLAIIDEIIESASAKTS
jgi:hypothetical protein